MRKMSTVFSLVGIWGVLDGVGVLLCRGLPNKEKSKIRARVEHVFDYIFLLRTSAI